MIDTQALRNKILDLAINGSLPSFKVSGVDVNDSLCKALNERNIFEHVIKNPITFKIPIGWKWIKLGWIVDIDRGGSPRPIKDYLTTDHNGINWIKIGDVSKDGKYGITTHSHPVVTYEDKTLVRKRLEELPDNDDAWEDMALLLNGEGVVWDKVEVNDTLLVCMSDQKERKLRSYDFCRLATAMLENTALSGEWQGHQLMELHSSLLEFGVTVLEEKEKQQEVQKYLMENMAYKL